MEGTLENIVYSATFKYKGLKLFMDEDVIREKLEDYLKEPSKEKFVNLTTILESYNEKRPPCPKCHSKDIVKRGFSHRKSGRVQQYRCNSCRHMYTRSSIESKKMKKDYSACPKCDSVATRSGFWRWTLKDGTKMENQRYKCTKCGYYFTRKNNDFEAMKIMSEYSTKGMSLKDASTKSKISESGFLKRIHRYSTV